MLTKIICFLLIASLYAFQDNASLYASCVESKPSGTSENPFCKCKPHSARSFLGNRLKVTPLCLKSAFKSPGGGIMGSLGGRVLWTPKAENSCVGSPLEIGIARVDEDKIIVSWAEDQGGDNFNPSIGKIHLTEINNPETNPTVGRDIVLNNCVYNGGVVITKDGLIATLCPKYTPTTIVKLADGPKKDNTLDLFIVEVGLNDFKVKRSVSITQKKCIEKNEGCFPKLDGEAFRYLKYDPIRHRYAYWVNSRWGVHVADTLIVLKADTLERVCGGDHWSNVGWHTAGTKIAFNRKNVDFGFVGVSDNGGAGLIFDKAIHRLYENGRTFVVPNKLNRQASMTWPGSIVSCGNHFYTAFHGVRSTDATDIDAGMARINALTGKVEKVTWIVTSTGNQKSAKIAVLSPDCSRFLFGYGSGAVDSSYPNKYYVVEVDKNGKKLTATSEVGQGTVWYENTEWISMSPGKVGWTTTWRRQKNGNPRVVTMEADGSVPNPTVRATGSDSGYGCQVNWDRTTTRFKTNELFLSVYTTTAATRPQTDNSYAESETWCCKNGLMKMIPHSAPASCFAKGCSTCINGQLRFLQFKDMPETKWLNDAQKAKRAEQLGSSPPTTKPPTTKPPTTKPPTTKPPSTNPPTTKPGDQTKYAECRGKVLGQPGGCWKRGCSCCTRVDASTVGMRFTLFKDMDPKWLNAAQIAKRNEQLGITVLSYSDEEESEVY